MFEFKTILIIGLINLMLMLISIYLGKTIKCREHLLALFTYDITILEFISCIGMGFVPWANLAMVFILCISLGVFISLIVPDKIKTIDNKLFNWLNKKL